MFGQYLNDQLGRNEMYLTKKGILVAAIFMSKNLYTDICRWHMMARMYSSWFKFLEPMCIRASRWTSWTHSSPCPVYTRVTFHECFFTLNQDWWTLGTHPPVMAILETVFWVEVSKLHAMLCYSSEKDMASVALIFGVGDDATYHNVCMSDHNCFILHACYVVMPHIQC